MSRCGLIFILMIIFPALVSCSFDALKDDSSKQVIFFDVSVSTKGLETEYIDSFYATAYSLPVDSPKELDFKYLDHLDLFFDEVLFEKNGGYYYSDPAYYWPDQRGMIFVLWTPSLDDLGMKYSFEFVRDENQEPIAIMLYKDFSPADDIRDQKDFLWSLAVRLEQDEIKGLFNYPNSGVEFIHALSGIEIKAKGNSEYQYSVKGIKIANVTGTGDLAFLEWIPSSEKKSYVCSYENNPIEFYGSDNAVNLMPSDKDLAFLIPQKITPWNPEDEDDKGAYISVLLKVTGSDGVVYPSSENYNGTISDDGYAWTAIPINSEEWEIGARYTYILDFTTGYGYPDPYAAE